MAHVHCMLDNRGYTHTLTVCNIITFPLQQWLQERYMYITCLVAFTLC